MLSQSEQNVLEEISQGSRSALLDIHTVISKVYDDELALDLNRQAAKYSRLQEKACLLYTSSGHGRHPQKDYG